MTADPAARRAAMAEAIKAKHAEIYGRPAWPAGTYWDELAEAADKAAEALRKDET